MDQLAYATFVLAGVTAVSVLVTAADGLRARRHESTERRRQREYDRIHNAYTKLRIAGVLAVQLRGAMKVWPLVVIAIPGVIRASATVLPKYAERLRDMEAAFVYTRFWGSPPWQRRSDQLQEAIVEATGWIRPLSAELNQADLRALDRAADELATMMSRVVLPRTGRRLVDQYLEALKPVIDELERRLNQLIAEGGKDRRSPSRKRFGFKS
ncbi:MAG: hypothetical protein J2P57_05780 [Acidimicrobiaceae bacterium]|nr:hypothetical protein [Acidimicrobiaceae bacterium]